MKREKTWSFSRGALREEKTPENTRFRDIVGRCIRQLILYFTKKTAIYYR